ncbi:hypothetical protein [Marivita sp.]|uniref:hypothetical protein n=1 Tax=Marivita sp. TaxID=2003365 RepID=UPI0025B8FC8F|nr:hypothetical protein [Marivita sp.]
MTKSDTNVGGGGDIAHPSSEFTSKAKQTGKPALIENNYVCQWDEEGGCGDQVMVISKCNDVCCAEKKMMDDPAYAELLHDLDNMTKMQLRKKYSGEACSHRNMLSRRKTHGAKVHGSLQAFPDFLRHVGPKPTKKATLDRSENDDREYAPGKVRWADKQTQNRNKGDSLIFTCPTTGRYFTASQLATKQGVKPATIRSRRARAWTDAEIIAGERQDARRVRKPRTSPSVHVHHATGRSAAQIAFERAKKSVERERAETGVEPFICTPAEMQEIFSDDPGLCNGEEWLRQAEKSFLRNKLPKYWKEYGPHINFNALTPEQQVWVMRIDPDQRQNLERADAL